MISYNTCSPHLMSFSGGSHVSPAPVAGMGMELLFLKALPKHMKDKGVWEKAVQIYQTGCSLTSARGENH